MSSLFSTAIKDEPEMVDVPTVSSNDSESEKSFVPLTTSFGSATDVIVGNSPEREP
jgi:hypothetical protein